MVSDDDFQYAEVSIDGGVLILVVMEYGLRQTCLMVVGDSKKS